MKKAFLLNFAMDFKQKIKSFISDIKDSAAKPAPEEESLPALLIESPAVAKFKEHLAEGESDPCKEAEVLASIEEPYFTDTDTSQYELENYPDNVQPFEIDRKRKTLKRQLQAVSRRVSELVLENQPGYSRELERVMDLERGLQEAKHICSSARRDLAHAQDSFTGSSLGLLHNYRQRLQLLGLLKALNTIKTLQRTDVRLREMVEEEDYAGAIRLCLECQKAAQIFRHYNCISELSTKLQDTLEQIEESLDVALSKACLNFDPDHYSRVQKAYALLAKTQTAMDQLHMHFTSAVHNTAFQIVLGYVQLVADSGTDVNYQKKNYADLCKNISSEVFTACLLDLCKALWNVMRNYHRTMLWHQKNMKAQPDEIEEARLQREYIEQKLQHGRTRVWGDVAAKVKVALLSTDLSHFLYDHVLQVLHTGNRLLAVGREFCGSQSEGLQESLRKQTLAYFRHYHRARLDELRMFLENEAWELCPVKAHFQITMLQEFKFLGSLHPKAQFKSKSATSNQNLSHSNMAASDGDHIDISESGTTNLGEVLRTDTGTQRLEEEGFFSRYLEEGTPFDVEKQEERTEDFFDTNGSAVLDSDDDVAEELKLDFVDEQTGETPAHKSQIYQRLRSKDRSVPLVTNTTINVCRLFGKYVEMMTVLTPIAFDVTFCMSQLFDYYLYSVYSFFVKEDIENSGYTGALSQRLQVTLKRIHDNLVLDLTNENEAEASATAYHDKVPPPTLSPMVQLTGDSGLQGLAERVVATESLVFLARQFELLQQQLEAVIPSAKRAFLQQFYSQTISVAGELRGPVYHTVALRSVSTDAMLQQMLTVKFDVKDIMSQHSPYVDTILHELSSFATRVDQVTRRVPVPREVHDVIWTNCIGLVNACFVEGYGSAKKCSNEGRALMQLDYQQFLLNLEKLTKLRPTPGREYVEGYIKAFYLPETQLEPWLRDHKEYTSKQLLALVSTVPHITKKARQRLQAMLEEADRVKRSTVEDRAKRQAQGGAVAKT